MNREEVLKSTHNLDKKAFNEFVLKTSLTEIYLKNLSVELKTRKFSNPTVNLKLSQKIQAEGENFYIDTTLDLKVKDGRTIPLKIKVTYRFEYVTGYTAPSEDFLKKYADTSARMHVWPYFREIVSNLISRMGLPPLTLPVISFIPE